MSKIESELLILALGILSLGLGLFVKRDIAAINRVTLIVSGIGAILVAMLIFIFD